MIPAYRSNGNAVILASQYSCRLAVRYRIADVEAKGLGDHPLAVSLHGIASGLRLAESHRTVASLAELELELGRERRAAAREARRARGQTIGRPKALDKSKSDLARRMHASGEPASTIAAALAISRATVYRVLAQQPAEA